MLMLAICCLSVAKEGYLNVRYRQTCHIMSKKARMEVASDIVSSGLIAGKEAIEAMSGIIGGQEVVISNTGIIAGKEVLPVVGLRGGMEATEKPHSIVAGKEAIVMEYGIIGGKEVSPIGLQGSIEAAEKIHSLVAGKEAVVKEYCTKDMADAWVASLFDDKKSKLNDFADAIVASLYRNETPKEEESVSMNLLTDPCKEAHFLLKPTLQTTFTLCAKCNQASRKIPTMDIDGRTALTVLMCDRCKYTNCVIHTTHLGQFLPLAFH